MIRQIKNLIRKIIFTFIKPEVQYVYQYNTYSQAGEDVVLNFLFTMLKITKPTYLDIGTSKPDYGNNTYLFYRQGGNGVCVEADPGLIESIKAVRPRDICLNVGVGISDTESIDFYVFDEPSLNTLIKEEAQYRQSFGNYKIVKTIQIPLFNINRIITENFETCPDFISIDVEGIDLEVLKTLDFDRYTPLAICVETVSYSESHIKAKRHDIIDFMLSKGYFIYADTYINTIFVNEQKFNQ